MKKGILLFLGLSVLIVLAVLASPNKPNKYPSYKLRYKMTVEIDTPEGVKSGSAIHQVSNSTPRIKFHDSGNPANVKGEAVAIDLGKRGVVFALMSDQSWENGLRAFRTDGNSTPDGIRFFQTLKPGMKAELKDYIPRMVTFKDLNDPKSVMLVYQNKTYAGGTKEYADHFEDIFGKGVKLKSITVEITDKAINWNIDHILPWITDLDTLLDGSEIITSRELSNNLGTGSFRRGKR